MGKKIVSGIQEETYSQEKKLPVSGRNLLSQEEASCHTKKHLKIDIKMGLIINKSSRVIDGWISGEFCWPKLG
jgi:hypothetical protein